MILGPEHPCFVEIDEACAQLQRERGDDRPVVFHWQAAIDDIPFGAIIYNFDFLNVHFGNEQALRASKRASEVWDFSARGAMAWRTLGVDAKHVPLGYHPSMERFERKTPDLDVVFVGTVNARRHAILAALEDHEIDVAFAPADRTKRDEMLARCRCSINMLFHVEGTYPMLRAAHLHANCVPFVGEVSFESEQDLACPMWSCYENLVDAVMDAVDHPLRDGYDFFKTKPLVLP